MKYKNILLNKVQQKLTDRMTAGCIITVHMESMITCHLLMTVIILMRQKNYCITYHCYYYYFTCANYPHGSLLVHVEEE